MQELPKYRSHKIVQAVKLEDVALIDDTTGESWVYPDDSANFDPIRTDPGYWDRCGGGPKDMGYYVRYEDGYESWSPSKAFEEGYTRIDFIELTDPKIEGKPSPPPAEPKSSPQKPSIGRIVHYMGPGTAGEPGFPGVFAPQVYPATVVSTISHESGIDSCNLFVMTEVGHMNLRAIPYSETPKPGHWSWPPRV